MTNYTSNLRFALSLAVLASAVLISGQLFEANAQRDPFVKAGYMKKAPVGGAAVARKPGTGTTGTGPATPINYGAPVIESRIAYYKQLREVAAANGQPLPKVTSVLTLSELAVTGIFKTPRGYAAMVEATPIKLSYTIYPGEKFFDGQLVAVEENKLIFRKVTKTAPNKFVASVEDKPLQQFSMKAQIEGTAPAGAADKTPQLASNSVMQINAGPIVSPLDEMVNQPADTDKAKTKKPGKKPAKLARNGK